MDYAINVKEKNTGIGYKAVDYDPFAEPLPLVVPTTEPQREVFASVMFARH